jgi:hypothetical protein
LEPVDVIEPESATSDPEDLEDSQNIDPELEEFVQPANTIIDRHVPTQTGDSRISLLSSGGDSTFSFSFGDNTEEQSTHDDGSLGDFDRTVESNSLSATEYNVPATDVLNFTIPTVEAQTNNNDLPTEDPSSTQLQRTHASAPESPLDLLSESAQTGGMSVDASIVDQAAPSALTETSLMDHFETSANIENIDVEVSVAQPDADIQISILVQAAVPIVADTTTLDPSELHTLGDADIDSLEKEDSTTGLDIQQEVLGDVTEEVPEESCYSAQTMDKSDIGWESDDDIEDVDAEPNRPKLSATQTAQIRDASASDNGTVSEDEQGFEVTERLAIVDVSPEDSQDVHKSGDRTGPEVLEESTIQEILNMEMEQDGPNEENAPTEVAAESTTSHVAEGSAQEPLAPDKTLIVDDLASVSADDDLAIDCIADGLTLALPSEDIMITEQTKPKLRSPARPARLIPQDDLTAYLDDDTALLKDFLTRAAASKLNKATSTIARRSSLSHRRDSDVIRHALASPRKILEDKDVNSPSPHKSYDVTATLDLSQTITLDPTPGSPSPDATSTDADVVQVTTSSSRRSMRSRKSRIPPPSFHTQQPQTPKSIPVRRTDGTEPIVLRRTEAQELGMLTRANTRKNKSSALAANIRLLKLATEDAVSRASPIDESANAPREGAGAGERKTVKWDETLVYFQEHPSGEALAVEGPGDVKMVDAPSEQVATVSFSTPSAKPKSKSKDKSSTTPRVRRLRGLGASNGTPGKGFLEPGSLLPDDVWEELVEEKKKIPKPPKARKLPVATVADAMVAAVEPLTLDVAACVPQPEKQEAKERKSRIATPRKGKIPVSTAATVLMEGKENRLAAGLPKKALGVDAGLPRRRASRKL